MCPQVGWEYVLRAPLLFSLGFLKFSSVFTLLPDQTIEVEVVVVEVVVVVAIFSNGKVKFPFNFNYAMMGSLGRRRGHVGGSWWSLEVVVKGLGASLVVPHGFLTRIWEL